MVTLFSTAWGAKVLGNFVGLQQGARGGPIDSLPERTFWFGFLWSFEMYFGWGLCVGYFEVFFVD